MDEAGENAVVAATAEAALRRFAGQPEAERILGAVAEMATADRLTARGTAETFIGCASAFALWPLQEMFDRLADLLARVSRVSNNWNTAPWYSRFHVQMAEAIVLGFPAVRGT